VSALTQVTQTSYWSVNATHGGEVKLSGLTSLVGTQGIYVTDTGSSTLLDPKLISLSDVTVTLDGTDAQVANAWTKFTNGSFNVTGGSYRLSGLTDVDESGLHVSTGGSLTLPGLTSYASYATFSADGIGSDLDLSALTQVTQSGYWFVNATHGGEVKLSGLTSLVSTQGVYITDTSSSTLLDPKLTSLSGVTVTLDGTDTQVANAWTKFYNGSFNVTGGSYSLSGLTDVDESGLHVSTGGSLTLPGLTSYASYATFSADGIGSVLDLSALTQVTQSDYWFVNATHGGEVKLSGLTSLVGTQGIYVTDTGSSTLLDPKLTSLSGVTVTLDGTDTQVANTWTKFYNGSFNVTGGSYIMPKLTDVDESSLHLSGGGSLALPGLTSYASYGTFSADGTGSVLDVSALTQVTQPNYWDINATHGGEVKLSGLTSLAGTQGIYITDTGSSTLLDPKLTSLSGVTATLDGTDTQVANAWTKFVNGSLSLTAGSYKLPGLTDVDESSLHISNGGGLTLPGLTSYASYGTFNADGTGSVLDVSALTQVTQSNYWDITATHGGEVKLSGLTSLVGTQGVYITDTGSSTLLDPNLTSLSGVTVTLDGTDTQVANTWTTFNASSLTVTGGAYSLPGLTNVDGSSLYTKSSGSLALPGLKSYSSNASTFQADGTGSVMDVSALTSLTQKNYWNIYATNGGVLKLSGMTALNSVDGIYIHDTNGGTVTDGGLTSLTNVNLTVDGTNENLTLNTLTTINGCNVTVSGGATLSLPGMMSCTIATGATTTLEATGAGSTLTLPYLTSLSVSTASLGSPQLFFEALAGGTVTLSALTQIDTGPVSLESDGAGSTLNVPQLTNFSLSVEANLSTLQVTQGGTVNAGNLTSLDYVNVTLDGTGTWPGAQLTSYVGGLLTLTGGTFTLGAADVDGSSFVASGGATLNLSAVTSYSGWPDTAPVFRYTLLEATDAGSVLSAPQLASLTISKNSGTYQTIEALAGGTVSLPALTYVSGGPVTLKSDGTGSVVDVSNLTHFNSTGGTVSASNNGIIKHPAPGTGGPLGLNSATQGGISNANPVNDWVFLGQPGQGITVTVVTGSQGFPNSWPPNLNYAQVSLTDSQGNVLASASNTQSGATVILQGVALPALGVYHIIVQAPAAQPSATGNYVITASDVTVHQFALTINQTNNGILDADSAVDHWTFSAAANTQVQFNLVAAAKNATEFDLTGPGGYTAFSDATTSSALITLPSAGNYVLTVHNGAGAYAFDLQQTAQADLALGTPLQGNLTGSGQAQLFQIVVTNAAPLLVTLTDPNVQDHNELYIQASVPPTRDVYDSRAVIAASPNQALVIVARPGTYFVLVYDDVVQTAGTFTVEAQSAPFIVTDMSPGTDGNGFDTTLQFTGGFSVSLPAPASGPGISSIADSPTIQFVSGSGSVFPANPIPLYYTGAHDPSGLPIVSVALPAHTLPAGTYAVRITDNAGYSVTLAKPLDVVEGGVGQLDVKLTVPNPIGYHESSTIYVQYSNVGTAPMPAPLLVLSATQKGQPGAFLTLDRSLVTSGFWSDTTPSGYSQSVQFLAGGANTGVLEPGESVTIPVYYAGWLQTQWDFSRPPIIFSVGELDATDVTLIDWSSLKAGLQLPTINQAAWDALYPNLAAQLGSTWGSYLQTLDNDAQYFASIGEPTTDLNALLAFEIQKANAAFTTQTLATVTDDSLPAPGLALSFQRSFQQSIEGRYHQGILGYGWTTNWEISAVTTPSGDAAIEESGISRFFTKQADGSFLPEAGDHATLTFTAGKYRLVETDGTVYQFNPDGTLNYVEDTHGNRITAGYTSGQLTTLTHSNGESLTLTYNGQGHLATLVDSNGLTETYGYDPTGQFLTTYTDRYGTTNYTYVTGQSPAQNNALASIAYADNTHIFFSYDAEGRLKGQHRDGGAEDKAYTYGAAGGYTVTDGNQHATTVLVDRFGAIAETIDPLGNVTRYQYDSNFNMVGVTAPLGTKSVYKYDSNGNMVSSTDPLGNTVQFTYDSNHNLLSYQDAKGNKTQYSYDASNDLLSITYADGTSRHISYNPLGEATQYVNARGNVINSTYNADGLLQQEPFADGTSLSYVYDSRGNLLKATDTSGNVTTFDYTDPRNSDFLTRVTYPDGTFLQFTNNVVGQRKQSVDQTGFTVNYVYDDLGRLSELTDGNNNLLVQYTYDVADNLIQKDNGNGTRTKYTYDADNNVLSITNLRPDHVTVNSFDEYTYDALGNVLTDTNQDGLWVYTYDAGGQLTHTVFTPNSANPDGLTAQDLQYVYDAAGNRMSETVNGAITTYVSNNVNEYTSSTTAGVGTTAYQYDADGNLISQTDASGIVTTRSFNQLNQLTAVKGPGLTASDAYNPQGELISATVNGTTTNYQIDPTGLGNVVATLSGEGVYNDNGGLTAHFIYGLGLVSQVATSGSGNYYDFDVTGNTIAISGSVGNYVNRYTYLPFGQTATATVTLANPFTFVGQFGAMNTGNDYFLMRARTYDSSTGQFVSPDSFGLSGGSTNLRLYVDNSPKDRIDPSGHWPWDHTYTPATDCNGDRYGFRPEGGTIWYWVSKDENGNWYYQPTAGGPYVQVPNDGTIGVYVPPSERFPEGEWRPVSPTRHGDPGDSNAGGEGGGGCPCRCEPPDPPAPPTRSGPKDPTSPVTSEDPNALVGPTGFGAPNFIAASAILPYRINFENDPTATAPAQRVDISNQLVANLDASTFQITGIGWGNINLVIPPDSQHFNTTVSMIENGKTFNVVVSAGISSTGLFTISFQSIDPLTNLPPDILTGFLPPNDSTATSNGTGRGTGYVTYIVKPKTGLATGTQIRNVALVTFDQGETIATDQVDEHDPSKGIDPTKQALVTIDSGAPTSSVMALPATESSPSFTVSWSGQDDAGGSGVASYDIYVSDNSGPLTLFLQNTAATSATFSGQAGQTYGFYSVATDNVGNVQAVPAQAQATTFVSPSITTITGTVFQDINTNGVQDPGEPGLAGQTLYLDLNGSSILAAGDPTATTDANGNYQFMVQGAGTYTIRQVLLGGVLLSTPAKGSYQVTVTGGANLTGQNFADVPTSIAVPLTLQASSPFPRHGNPDADFVEAVYRAVLKRDADAGGLASWTAALKSGGLSRLQVVQGVRNSSEHFTDEVTDLYFTILNRAPDATGLQDWVQKLETGEREEQVAFAFLDSPEYLSEGDKHFVDQMYLALVGRTFDAAGESSWLNALGDDPTGKPTHSASMTHEQVITDFLYSQESLDRLVEGYYQVFLQRLADTKGLNDWVAALQQGGSFLTIGEQFLSSNEFYNRAAAQG
jgi:RHS repeat-associated protein